MLAFLAAAVLAQPVITVAADDTKIDRSCTVRIAPGTLLKDSNGDGAIHITADGITVEFEKGSRLHGATTGARPDGMTGIGIRIDGRKNVALRGARISGFKVGIRATDCPGLKIDDADLRDNYRRHLASTPEAEAASDWLYPHRNDNDEWTTQHGAAISIKNAIGVALTNITARRTQNGIVLDRVTDSVIIDNDCSFLSGWGLAMWRSSGNVVASNAFDFCIRGYSHGIYNRGQDSAGILMFERAHGTSSWATPARTAGTASSVSRGAKRSARPPRPGRTSTTAASATATTCFWATTCPTPRPTAWR